MLRLYRETLRTELVREDVNGQPMLVERPILGPVKATFGKVRIPLTLARWIHKRWYAGA